jgi:hypothetical protein
MAKSFDEQYADALVQLEKVQKKVAALKAKKEKRDAMKNEKIGKAITSTFPKLLDMMEDKNFKIEEFIRTAEFSRAFHFTFVQLDERKIPEWAKDNKEENQIETTDINTEIVDEGTEVETINPVNQYVG